MATEYRLSYTASEIDSKLGKIDSLANKTDVPTKTSDLTNDSGFATQTYVQNFAQPKGDYALRSELPEVPDAPVSSVNGQTGEVQLTAHDVGALPNTVEIPVNLSDLADDSTHRLVTDDEKTSWSAKAEVSAIPKNLGELVNDVGYLTAHQDLSDYAKTSDVTTIIAAHNTNGSSHNDLRILIENVKTDLKAIADSDDETLDQMSEVVAYIKSNKELIDAITTSKVSVADIVDDLVTNVSTKPLSAAQGVALKTMIEAIVVPTKVSDLANDVGFITEIPTEYITEAELSERGYLTEHQSLDGYAKTSELGTLAAKDVVAKSDLTEEVQASLDKADTALQSYTETDPTVPAWAKAVNPPTYTAADVGALPNTTVIPDALADLTEDTEHRLVSDAEKAVWNAKLEQSDIPTNVSAFTNDSGYLTSSAIDGLATESYVGSMLEAIDYPVDSVNGKTGAVVLSASDVGADPVGVAEEAISAHDASTTSHADIRSEIETLSTGVAYIDVTDNENVEIISHIDSELSETSENPVQNKVITNAISSLSAEKIDKTDIVQVAGDSETAVMSQKATTELFKKVSPVEETEIEPTKGLTISGGKLYFDNKDTTQTAVIPLEKNQNVIITVSGVHNRLLVAGMTSTNLVNGAACQVVFNSGNTATRDTTETFEFKNEAGYAQLVVAVSYVLANVNATVRVASYTKIALGGIPIATEAFVLERIKSYRPYISKTSASASTMPETIYSVLDGLKTAYPSYVSMSVLGTDTSGNEIREYTFAPTNYNQQATHRSKDNEIAKETVLIVAGIHGDERSATASLVQFLTDLCNGNEALYGLRERYIFRVVPVGTPYSFKNNRRTNINGVNINRNFNASWTLIEDANNYSGTSAADQKETQLLQSWIDGNAEAKLFVDVHNSGYTNEVSCLLADNSGEGVAELKRKYLKGIDFIIPYWKISKDFYESNVMSYTGVVAASGTAAIYAQSKGILSCTLELSWAVNGTEMHSALSVVTGAEAIGNMLLEVLDA